MSKSNTHLPLPQTVRTWRWHHIRFKRFDIIWYINLWLMLMVNKGKYTIPMDGKGMAGQPPDPLLEKKASTPLVVFDPNLFVPSSFERPPKLTSSCCAAETPQKSADFGGVPLVFFVWGGGNFFSWRSEDFGGANIFCWTCCFFLHWFLGPPCSNSIKWYFSWMFKENGSGTIGQEGVSK